jgi:hypothetical protein
MTIKERTEQDGDAMQEQHEINHEEDVRQKVLTNTGVTPLYAIDCLTHADIARR